MTQLEISTQYVEDAGGFSGELPIIIQHISSIVPDDIPTRMSATIAVSEIVTFAGNLRRNIQLDADTLLPVNAISFAIASSGVGKDSTVKGIRKVFADGYKVIGEERLKDAKTKAIHLATTAGRENPESFGVYNEFYEKPPILFAGISTEQGLFKQCNRLERAKLGAGHIYTGELGSELQTNSNMITNIKLSSILYDIGSADVTLLKGEDGQLEPIENLPVSALFVGSQENILFDESIKLKFKMEFTSKLARRSFLSYTPEDMPRREFATAQDRIEYTLNNSNKHAQTVLDLRDSINNIARHHIELPRKNKPIAISNDARALYIMYKDWCKDTSDAIKADYPISKITVEHRHWAALKLAGAFAMITGKDEISKDNYVDAINYIHFMAGDLPAFENELRKDTYELFIDYVHSVQVDGKTELPFHKLLQQGYVHKGGAITAKVKELVKLANSKDVSGVYTITENTVQYEKTILTDAVGVSYMLMPEHADKQQRAVKVANGKLEYTSGTFEDLVALLSMDMAYSPFEFRDGKRKNDNLIPGAKWVTLDIDDGVVTDEVAHEMLSDINHIIARTSNPDNPLKYRILIELDSVITLDSRQWKKFMAALENYLVIPIDKLPMSQIYYAWSNRNVMSVTNQKPLETKDLLLIATEVVDDTNFIDTSKMSNNAKTDLLNNPQDTFEKAYFAEDGKGSRALVGAMHYMRKLGASADQAEKLLTDINNYWVCPLPEGRFRSTILSQIPGIWSR